MAKQKIIIAIDGYSACGKSTLAKALAKKLNYHFIDSGAMYRAITLYFLREGVSLGDEQAIGQALDHVKLSFENNQRTGDSEILLNGENVARAIRDMLVAEKVSEVAAIKAVRQAAVAQQQLMGKRRGIVMDGRDIGTVVFPDAELKIFMTADPAIRVKRRFEEQYEKDPAITIEEIKANLELRDYIDSNREESPLRKAKDAIVLDNSSLTRAEQLDKVLAWVKELQQPATA
ncbi:MAG: (d)CMP kinase [Bacteroidetes bacterium]|nr:(d)CMP kinase [Bacteroidota bacterium]